MNMVNTGHMPVLLKETLIALKLADLAHLQNEPDYKPKFIDATLGAGGHTIEMIKGGGSVLGIDADARMIQNAIANITKACPASSTDGTFLAIQGNFSDLKRISSQNGFEKVDGVLFDLGISSIHLDSVGRGFSFKNLDDPLDMRLDTDNLSVTAADLLNALPKGKLASLFESVLNYSESRKLADAICVSREVKKIETVGDFILIVRRSRIGAKSQTDPATKPMMALRMAVNSELEVLELGLNAAVNLLTPGGRLVVISFHSGEDKVVKNFVRKKVTCGDLESVSGIITPSEAELKINIRARSAKMRVAIKI